MPRRTNQESGLLRQIIRFYLDSPDSNGIPLDRLAGEPTKLAALRRLIREGSAEIVSEAWDCNPHVKRQPAPKPEVQLEALSQGSSRLICVYPSANQMKRVLGADEARSAPFTRLLMLAHPCLEPLFFDLAALDRYRSDPRYIFCFDGLDGRISMSYKSYRARSMRSSDKVMLQSFGLGFGPRGEHVAVVFLRYLAQLTSRHQLHWQSHRLTGKFSVEWNYYRRCVFGEWTDGLSVYEAFLQDLQSINRICEAIGSPPLFKNDYSEERPEGFGLLLRTTKRSFLEFVHTLDKMISENLNADFFSVAGLSLDAEVTRDNGSIEVVRKATLRLLGEWMGRHIKFREADACDKILAPLKEVRALRQKPAHALVGDEFSLEFQEKKAQLMNNVYQSISNIRFLFQRHPRARNCQIPAAPSPEHIAVF